MDLKNGLSEIFAFGPKRGFDEQTLTILMSFLEYLRKRAIMVGVRFDCYRVGRSALIPEYHIIKETVYFRAIPYR